jgi:hypothetical protein
MQDGYGSHQIISFLSSKNINPSEGNVTLLKSISIPFNIFRLQSKSIITKSEIYSIPGIQFAEQNLTITPRSDPNDPLFIKQWSLSRVKASQSWDKATGDSTMNGDQIVVGVIDFGFLITHEDLKNKFWINKKEIPSNNIDDDQNGYIDDINGWSLQPDHTFPVSNHGTAVVSILAAEKNNHVGMAGCSNSKIILGSTPFLESDIIELYTYMYQLRKKYNETKGKEGVFIPVINFSVGVQFAKAIDHPIWCNLYDKMGEVGILNCAATANEDVNVDIDGDMPTTCTSNYLLTVTSTTEIDDSKSLTGYGIKSIDIGGPGENIIIASSNLNNNFTSGSGTSFATPLVTGAVTLIYSYPCKAWAELIYVDPAKAACIAKQAILEGVDRNNSLAGKTVSGGRLNISKSIDWLQHNICEANLQSRSNQIDHLVITPNPSNGIVNLYAGFNCEGYQLRIFDEMGRQVYAASHIASYQNILLPTFSDGIYFIQLRNGLNMISKKLVILK